MILELISNAWFLDNKVTTSHWAILAQSTTNNHKHNYILTFGLALFGDMSSGNTMNMVSMGFRRIERENFFVTHLLLQYQIASIYFSVGVFQWQSETTHLHHSSKFIVYTVFVHTS